MKKSIKDKNILREVYLYNVIIQNNSYLPAPKKRVFLCFVEKNLLQK